MGAKKIDGIKDIKVRAQEPAVGANMEEYLDGEGNDSGSEMGGDYPINTSIYSGDMDDSIVDESGSERERKDESAADKRDVCEVFY